MEIETFTLGPFETNCSLVTDAGELWVVDASFDPQEMIDRVRELGIVPKAIVLTHAHVDHIAGVADVRRAFPGTPVWIHRDEQEWLADPVLNLSAMMGQSITAPGPDRLLADADELTLGNTHWRVLHTPGHSPGGVAFYCAQPGGGGAPVLIGGDALFAGSVGRSDFPGSDPATLARSIRTRLYTLPDDTIVYPGHGPTTTIGREKRSNPFVRA
ncbi:MAG: MBL fold metallo-hydrolase [Planctomycetota bacterium]